MLANRLFEELRRSFSGSEDQTGGYEKTNFQEFSLRPTYIEGALYKRLLSMITNRNYSSSNENKPQKSETKSAMWPAYEDELYVLLHSLAYQQQANNQL